MFEIDRTFSSRNPDSGFMDWYFSAWEGVYGPYSSKEKALEELNKFIQFCIETGDDGGRGKPEADRLSIMPKESLELTQQNIPPEKKQGK
jgi:hypothetical protein